MSSPGYLVQQRVMRAHGVKKIRVLIIEEHSAVRRALAARLQSWGHVQLATARTFHDSLELVTTFRPHVVLLELKSKSEHWPDPVGELRKALNGDPVGIIVLTTYADEYERKVALEAGAQRYLLKQIDSNQLVAEIEAVAAEAAIGAG